MSEVMLHGVLNMPPELWDDSPIDRMQRHSRYVEASALIVSLQEQAKRDKLRIAELEQRELSCSCCTLSATPVCSGTTLSPLESQSLKSQADEC